MQREMTLQQKKLNQIIEDGKKNMSSLISLENFVNEMPTMAQRLKKVYDEEDQQLVRKIRGLGSSQSLVDKINKKVKKSVEIVADNKTNYEQTNTFENRRKKYFNSKSSEYELNHFNSVLDKIQQFSQSNIRNSGL